MAVDAQIGNPTFADMETDRDQGCTAVLMSEALALFESGKKRSAAEKVARIAVAREGSSLSAAAGLRLCRQGLLRDIVRECAEATWIELCANPADFDPELAALPIESREAYSQCMTLGVGWLREMLTAGESAR